MVFFLPVPSWTTKSKLPPASSQERPAWDGWSLGDPQYHCLHVGQPGKARESHQDQEQRRGTRSAGTRQAQICPHPAKLEQPKINECAPTAGEMYHGNFSKHPNSLRGLDQGLSVAKRVPRAPNTLLLPSRTSGPHDCPSLDPEKPGVRGGAWSGSS